MKHLKFHKTVVTCCGTENCVLLLILDICNKILWDVHMSELSLKSVSENYCKFQIKFSKSHDINQQYLK